MNEADVRLKVGHSLRALGYWDITQTDLNAPYPIAPVNKLLGQLIGMTKRRPSIQKVVFALKAVLGKAVARPPKGRPDILCLSTTSPSIVVEVKVVRPGETSFPFSRIDDSQRKWQDRWLDDGGRGYIALGVIRQHGKVQRLDHLYLVDWRAWRRTEGLITPTQASIPVCADKCRSKLLKEKNWVILHLLRPWEMVYEDKLWRLPESHTAHPLREGNSEK